MTFRGGGFLYRKFMALRRLSAAGVGMSVDAGPGNEDIVCPNVVDCV